MWFVAQSSLLKSSILVVGAGGLGSPALLYLAACGVGKNKMQHLETYPRFDLVLLAVWLKRDLLFFFDF